MTKDEIMETLEVSYEGFHKMKDRMTNTISVLVEDSNGTDEDKTIYLAMMNMTNFTPLENAMLAAVYMMELAKTKMVKNDESTS